MLYKETIENSTLGLLTKLMSDNFDEPIMMSDRKPLNWKKIENRLRQMLKYPNKVFEFHP